MLDEVVSLAIFYIKISEIFTPICLFSLGQNIMVACGSNFFVICLFSYKICVCFVDCPMFYTQYVKLQNMSSSVIQHNLYTL